jgi:tRNA threonylcarbamoyl adenosine modification protein (Sua5/YciO/YrdC/YwlC family)
LLTQTDTVMVKTNILTINPRNIDAHLIDKAVEALSAGKVIALPTETVYGLCALSTKPEALKKIYELKGRESNKPLAAYVNDLDSLKKFDIHVPDICMPVLKKFWPGPLTVIFAKTTREKQGIRCSSDPIAHALIDRASFYVCGTSANISGDSSSITAQEVLVQFQNNIDYVIDGGRCFYGEESTILDISHEPFVIVRNGVIADEVKQCLTELSIPWKKKMTILIVCTGNTCRSPMTEGWLRKFVMDKHLDDLYEVKSCGTYAPFNLPPSSAAVEILSKEGIDISRHRSQTLTAKLVHEADRIIVMTKDHERAVYNIDSTAKEKTLVLDIEDPLGRGTSFYEESFETMKGKIKEQIAWIFES